MQNHKQTQAAFGMVRAIAEAIRELKRVPSGELYARVMGHVSLESYQQIIIILKNSGLVSENSFELIWIGKEVI